jgi:hypothetical protein
MADHQQRRPQVVTVVGWSLTANAAKLAALDRSTAVAQNTRPSSGRRRGTDPAGCCGPVAAHVIGVLSPVGRAHLSLTRARVYGPGVRARIACSGQRDRSRAGNL